MENASSQLTNQIKKILVFGASLNPQRVSNLAILRLRAKGFNTVAVGGRKGKVGDVEIAIALNNFENVDTITLYMGEKRQKEYEEYLLSLRPRRIIFNPGAENPTLYAKAKDAGIEVLNACTLVMLATGSF